MSKHTPGPWCVVNTGTGSIIIDQIKKGGGTPDLATVHCLSTGIDAALANADLIAAAPELLDALKQATNQLDRDYKFTPLDGSAALILKLRAAIAKAEGH